MEERQQRMAKELLKRSEVKEEHTWKVSDMYESTAEWEQALNQVKEIADRIAGMEGRVTESAANLYQVLKDCDAYGEIIDLAFNYAQRLYDQDRNDSTHQAMSQKVYGVWADVAGMISFIEPEILAVPEEQLETFYKELPELESYRGKIAEIQRLRGHSLSAEMEKLLAMTSEMSQTPEQVFAVMNSADIRFPEITDENGEKVRLTHGNYVLFLQSADRCVRKHLRRCTASTSSL